jgi:hypothetical protein
LGDAFLFVVGLAGFADVDRAAGELNDAIRSGGCFRGKRGVIPPTAMDAALDRAGDERFFGLRKFGIAEGNDDTLTM